MFNVFYSLGDFSGRTLGRLRSSYPRVLYISGSLARLSLVFTSFLIAYQHYNDFWSNSATILINSYLIGLSGGYFCVVSGNSFPGRLEDKEKEFGGFIISCMINLGIAIGSLISLLAFEDSF